jgi:hypothetical protein
MRAGDNSPAPPSARPSKISTATPASSTSSSSSLTPTGNRHEDQIEARLPNCAANTKPASA